MSRMQSRQAMAYGGQAARAWMPEPSPSRARQTHKRATRRQADVRSARAGSPPRAQGSQHDVRANTLSKVLMYVTLAVAMALLFMQIGRLADIAGRTKQIATLTSSIRELDNERNNLQVRLSMQQNINRVRDEAVYSLGMVRPGDEQIRVVSLNGYSANALTQTADGAVGTNAAE